MNNDHLQRTANNCLNSTLCVPFSDKSITSRKLGDEDIHEITKTEGKVYVYVIPFVPFLRLIFPLFDIHCSVQIGKFS